VTRALLVLFLVFGWSICSPQTSNAASGDQWNEVLTSARKEGRVVLGSIQGGPEFRQAIANGFRKRFGVDLVLRVLRSAELTTVLDRECDAGRPTIDVVISGNSELRTLLPKGCLQPVKPKLLLPEVVKLEYWRGGFLKFNDPQRQFLLQPTEQFYGGIMINSNLVKAGEILSAKDLLKAAYKGKIASVDPRRPGPGQAMATYLLTVFGDDFLRKLYLDQKPVFTTDDRQLADWVARGVHLIGLGTTPRGVEPLRKQGLPLGVIHPKDAPGYSTGGVGIVKMIKNSSYPNAATILVNWLVSKEGQTIYSRGVSELSRRTDVQVDEIPEYIRPQPGVKYLDTYDHEFYLDRREEVTERLLKTLGR
jgi:ABC-type Fe3+ transport system substrate-binding protein